jgi:hypothetical protein
VQQHATVDHTAVESADLGHGHPSDRAANRAGSRQPKKDIKMRKRIFAFANQAKAMAGRIAQDIARYSEALQRARYRAFP